MINITESTGFIGSNIMADVNARGCTDLLLVDDLGNKGKWKNIAKRGFLDLVDDRDLEGLLTQITEPIKTVFHIGANSSTTSTDGDEIALVNSLASTSRWKWCSKHKKPFIYASSAVTYRNGNQGFDDHENPEALDRLAALNLYGGSNTIRTNGLSNAPKRAKLHRSGWD